MATPCDCVQEHSSFYAPEIADPMSEPRWAAALQPRVLFLKHRGDQFTQAESAVYRQTRRPQWVLGQIGAAIGEQNPNKGLGDNSSRHRPQFASLDRFTTLGRFYRDIGLERFGQHISPQRTIVLECLVDLINRTDDVRRIARKL